MVAPTFLTTAESDGTFCMNDIKVTPKDGTTAPSIKFNKSINGITAGEFIVQFLNNLGQPDAQYTWLWYAEGTQASYVTKTKWQIMDTTSNKWRDCTTEELTAKHDAGVAMWIQGAGHKLEPAGAVDKADVEFVTSTANYTAVGNNSPVQLTISDLTVTPKTGTTAPSIKFNKSINGITAGEFIVQFLNNLGQPDAQYTWLWYAEGTQASYVTKTKWQIMDTSTNKWRDCTESELAYVVPAGKGLWVQGAGHTLNIPAPEGL